MGAQLPDDLEPVGGGDLVIAEDDVRWCRGALQRFENAGLVVADLVRAQNLQAKPEQLQAHIEELSQSYEKPAEVMRWYLSDRQRMAEVEAVVIENNVAEYVLAHTKVTDKALAFDDLMTA